ncbi:hypothetical protein H1235_13750 [Pseudoxanthomonas sp. NC8]|nr:hypothetical protein H1235_13750 [Pseudoxanthomonas sp. NC8]
MIVVGGMAGVDHALLDAEGVAWIDYPNTVIGAETGTSRAREGAFFRLYGNEVRSTGTLMAWAQGASRIIDAIAGDRPAPAARRCGSGHRLLALRQGCTGGRCIRPARGADYPDRVGQRRRAVVARRCRGRGRATAAQRVRRAALAGRCLRRVRRQCRCPWPPTSTRYSAWSHRAAC